MKAQVAIEYLIVASVVIGTAVTFFYYAATRSSESIVVSQAKESVEILSKTIRYIYASGPGAQTTVIIEIPTSIVDSYVRNNEIGFKIGVGGRVMDVYEITKVNVVGSLPTSPGRHVILVNYTATGVFVGRP